MCLDEDHMCLKFKTHTLLIVQLLEQWRSGWPYERGNFHTVVLACL